MRRMGYEGLMSETIAMSGHNGDPLEAYVSRPLGISNVPGVVVIHHMPGWDEWTKEVTRKLAYHGYASISPHLFSRHGPGSWADLAAAGRAAGGMPDAQVVGDIAAAANLLRSQPYSNGKIGVIGFCSGGRQAYMVACKVRGIDAAVDCWGGRVIAKPEDLSPRQPQAVIDMTPEMACPLLGIFGNDDASPDPDQVNRTEAVLRDLGKDYEFHRYDGAGHGFFATDRPNYRPEQAVDAWKHVFAFFEKYLSNEVREPAAARA
jgi:carboxymethylenebutenolidase